MTLHYIFKDLIKIDGHRQIDETPPPAASPFLNNRDAPKMMTRN